MTQIEIFQRGIHSRPFSSELNAYNGILGAEWDYGGALTSALVRSMSILAIDPWQVKIADLSYWQGDIDFEKMATQVQVVILRSIYGNKTIDSRLNSYYQKAKDNGLEVMLYHYLKPSLNWETHAKTFIQIDKDYPNIGLWGDLEETGGLGKIYLESWIKKYFDMVRSHKEKTGIYSSKGFLDGNLGRTNWLKFLDLWVASWTTASQPPMPLEWTDINNPRTWKLWQWTSKGNGLVHGVSSKYIDLNRYNGTIDQFNAEYNTNIKELGSISDPPPPPTPPTPPSPPAPPSPPSPVENVMTWYVKATSTPYLNVRAEPKGRDIGNLYPLQQFKIKNIVYGYNGAWAQIAEGEFKDKWACLHENNSRYCEPIGM